MANTNVCSAQPRLKENLSGQGPKPYVTLNNFNNGNKDQLEQIIQDLRRQVFVSDSSILFVSVNFNSS